MLLLGWKPDVVCVYNLVTLGAVARLGRWFRGVPFVLDVQDLWPESIFQSGMGASWMLWPIRYICDFAYRGADRIVAQSDGFRAELVRRGVEPRRIEVIHNWMDESSLLGPAAAADLDEHEDLKLSGRFNIVYAGNLGAAQGLENAIQAASITSRLNPRIQWVFVGNGVRKGVLKAMASDIAPRSTLFLPARPQSAMPALACRAEVLLIHLRDSALFSITIPSKVQASLAMGRPVIAVVSGDSARLVELSGAGFVCAPGQPARLADAADRMAKLKYQDREAMGTNGRGFYFQELSMAKGVANFEQVLLNAVRERTGRTGDRTPRAHGDRSHGP
jgi:glycosyltransferase involved in cell wall biosynthesis